MLVDHNEAAQSVPGLEQAEIVEIIDHHRLADIQTGGPIYFRNEPVGSTATIISEMYQERGLMPPAKLAGLIAAAIVADTVMFKSPTSTAVDRRMAERMARIANILARRAGQAIFSASISDDKPADALLFADFKDFHIADHDFGVSQITCVDSERMMQRKLLEGTQILYIGDEEIFSHAFNTPLRTTPASCPAWCREKNRSFRCSRRFGAKTLSKKRCSFDKRCTPTARRIFAHSAKFHTCGVKVLFRSAEPPDTMDFHFILRLRARNSARLQIQGTSE